MAKKILAYMDFMCPTGFGSVAHNVMDRLTPWFKKMDIEVDIACLNYGSRESEQYNEQIMAVNPRVFARNTDDYWYREAVLKMLQVGDYDMFWAMNDVAVLGPLVPLLSHINNQKQGQGRKVFKSMMYTPIDSIPYPKHFKDLDVWDEMFTYTEYGRKEAEKAFQKANNRKVKFGVIPHGMDTNDFKPLKNKKELRDKYNLPVDIYVFGNINKNQPRKDIGGTILAFVKFKIWLDSQEIQKKVGLYLHCYHSDRSGIRILDLCERLGLVIGVDVFLPVEERYNAKGYSLEEMNEIYNCLDCYISTTTAEGWGLTITEAMSVGLPIICGNHTSLTEITDNGKLVYAVNDLVEHIQIGDGENIRYVLNTDAVFEQMKKAWLLMNKVSVNTYKHKFAEYNWDKIADQWKGAIKRLIKI